MEGMRCALCGAGADVHCAADAAFLCAPCDAQVHGANLPRLAPPPHARLGAQGRVRDVVEPLPFHGRLGDDDGRGAASTADEEAHEDAPHNGRGGDRGVGKRMSVVAPGAARRVAAAAARAIQDVPAAPRVPLRVAMAAALWREVAAQGVHGAAGDALRRLEACARVPARLVVAVASSMGRARVKRVAASNTEEGWGECS